MKLNENLKPLVMAKAGEGASAQAIADWLLTEHKVKITDRGVRQFLQKVAKERAPVAQAIVRDALVKTLTPGLAALDGILARAQADELAAGRLDDALRELERLAMGDIGQAFDENGLLRPLKDMPEDIRRAIAGIEVERATELHGEVTKVKFWSKVDALKELIRARIGVAPRELASKARDQQIRALELRFKLAGATEDPDKDKPQGVILLPPETPDE